MTYFKMWTGTMVGVLFLSLFVVAWWTPLEIDHDQHMVDTVNERMLNYTPTNGTLTDFTDAEIMSNDAELDYEERVWKLEHPELYWIGNIIPGILFQLLNLVWAGVYLCERDSSYGIFEDYIKGRDDDYDDEEEEEYFEEEEDGILLK